VESWNLRNPLLLLLNVASQACSYPCQCPSQVPLCPLGNSLLLDGCGCCRVCSRQLGELCSRQDPCDHHKGLYCDFSQTQKDSGICLAYEGSSCVLMGKTYLNGESFQPSCQLRCICMHGSVGCIPLCPDGARLPPPDCPFHHWVKVQNKCCEEWVCEGKDETQSTGTLFAPKPELKLKSTLNDLQVNCLVQTTEWNVCSKTCGMGISTRITNDNPQCQLEKESRLCLVRFFPFKEQESESPVRRKKRCLRNLKSREAINFEFTGCTSVHSYQPKFCSSCTDNHCCTPRITSTVEVQFQCPEGESFVQKMMFIKSCSCHFDCPAENDVFLHTNVNVLELLTSFII
uniref:Connective tissue growth factor n=1 Tax=Naja naja TaxID=35670 RepID=A0A8C6VLQ3_NAJNA